MEDWIVDLLTWAFILGGAALYAWFAIRFTTPPRTDYRTALRIQAKRAEEKAKVLRDAMTLDDWLSVAAIHLMKILPGITYDWAMKELRDHLEDAIRAWPSPEWDWSISAAVEAAEDYVRDYGEQYGANQ